MSRLLLLALAGVLLAACTEKPQTIGTRVHDETPYAGTPGGPSPYTVDGWSPGDKNSWQQQLRVRTQRGQNEYNRM